MTRAAQARQAAITVGSTGLGLLLRPFTRPPRDATPPSRIVLLRPCCLGDVLMMTPLLAALDQAYPDAMITFATGEWAGQALQHNPHVDRLLTIPNRPNRQNLRTLAALLHQEDFDLACIPDRSPLLGLACALAGIPRRVGLDSAGRGFALTDRVPLNSDRHETDLALDLAHTLGLTADRRLTYHPSAASVAKIADLLVAHGKPTPLFVVHPGGGANPGTTMDTKRWPPERFAQVTDALLAQHGGVAILVGANTDRAALNATSAAMQQSPLDLSGQLSLDELAALCARATLYLGNDAGTTHLAEASGAPTVVIFGPTDPAQYGPLDTIGEAVWDPIACLPHIQRGDLTRPSPAQTAIRCIDAITVPQVLAAADRVLTRAANHQRTAQR